MESKSDENEENEEENEEEKEEENEEGGEEENEEENVEENEEENEENENKSDENEENENNDENEENESNNNNEENESSNKDEENGNSDNEEENENNDKDEENENNDEESDEDNKSNKKDNKKNNRNNNNKRKRKKKNKDEFILSPHKSEEKSKKSKTKESESSQIEESKSENNSKNVNSKNENSKKNNSKQNQIFYSLEQDRQRLGTLINFKVETDIVEDNSISNDSIHLKKESKKTIINNDNDNNKTSEKKTKKEKKEKKEKIKKIKKREIEENTNKDISCYNNDIMNNNDDILNKNIVNNYNNDLSNIIVNDEINFLNLKIKYLEERNMRLDNLNQMYYDIIKTTNLDYLRNGQNNNNLNFQSLAYTQNMRPNTFNKNFDNNDFMIQCYIDNERNKNIHDFSDSMININSKITSYLIDNCVKEKEKNNVIEEIRNEIGEKLDKINKIQKKQKHDIDFIIKYGLNKNRSLDPIIGALLDQPKPLPKLVRDDDEVNNQYERDKLNLTPFKNFSVYGRYSKKKNFENNSGKILRKSGSSIFENTYKNEYNYKIDEDSDPHKYNHNIYPNYSKRPILEKVNSDINFDKYKYDINIQKNKTISIDDNESEYEKEKFKAYNGKFFLPADFRFGGKQKKNK